VVGADGGGVSLAERFVEQRAMVGRRGAGAGAAEVTASAAGAEAAPAAPPQRGAKHMFQIVGQAGGLSCIDVAGKVVQ
jgi:hypothetical protein